MGPYNYHSQPNCYSPPPMMPPWWWQPPQQQPSAETGSEFYKKLYKEHKKWEKKHSKKPPEKKDDKPKERTFNRVEVFFITTAASILVGPLAGTMVIQSMKILKDVLVSTFK